MRNAFIRPAKESELIEKYKFSPERFFESELKKDETFALKMYNALSNEANFRLAGRAELNFLFKYETRDAALKTLIYTLGTMCLKGECENFNDFRSALKGAAENENTDARYQWGLVLEKEGNFQDALYQFEKAAASSQPDALYRLGELSVNGSKLFNIEPDEKVAKMYFQMAHLKGSTQAEKYLDKQSESFQVSQSIICNQNTLEENTPEELYQRGERFLQENRLEEARGLFQQAAGHGNAQAKFQLGMVCLKLRQKTHDIPEKKRLFDDALVNLNSAHKDGIASATFQLIVFSERDRLYSAKVLNMADMNDISKTNSLVNKVNAIPHLELLARLEPTYSAMDELQKTINFLKLAAKEGYPPAAYWFAKRCICKIPNQSSPEFNSPISLDYQRVAYQNLKIAAEGGIADAWYLLAMLLLHNYPLVVPEKKGTWIQQQLLIDKYLNNAVESGHQGAAKVMGLRYAARSCSWSLTAPFFNPSEHANAYFKLASKPVENKLQRSKSISELKEEFKQIESESVSHSDYENARVRELTDGAAEGLPDALFQVGRSYLKGDKEKAKENLAKAAEKGHCEAAYTLGFVFESSAKERSSFWEADKKEKFDDEENAIKFYGIALEIQSKNKDFSFAYNIARIYKSRFDSDKTKSSKNKAIHYYQIAARTDTANTGTAESVKISAKQSLERLDDSELNSRIKKGIEANLEINSGASRRSEQKDSKKTNTLPSGRPGNVKGIKFTQGDRNRLEIKSMFEIMNRMKRHIVEKKDQYDVEKKDQYDFFITKLDGVLQESPNKVRKGKESPEKTSRFISLTDESILDLTRDVRIKLLSSSDESGISQKAKDGVLKEGKQQSGKGFEDGEAL